MKRALHLFHRWAGLLLCLLFALWFASGIFMMYVEFPQLTQPERLAAAPALDFTAARWSPAAVAVRLTVGDFAWRGTPTRNLPVPALDPAAPARIEAVRLAMLLGRPAYVLTSGAAQPVAMFADTGERLGRVTVEQAAHAAAAFAPNSRPRFLRTVQSDQWAVSGGLNPHRPLHLFALDDAAGTELYVSSVTGEVVRDSTRRERVLNYFAAVTHWIYPHALRQFPDAWGWVVDVFAGAGTLLAISGLWIGVERVRRPLPVARSRSLHWLRWHILAGLAFGVTTLTWVFSGWMSMNPGKLNPPRALAPAQTQSLAGRAFAPAEFTEIPALPAGAVEASLGLYDGQLLVLATARDGSTVLAPALSGQPLRRPTIAALTARASALLPGVPLAGIEVLTHYDNQYYSRHPERGGTPLPILRVRFSDADGTWFHLDPATGQIINRSSSTNRLFRHLYHGLHSLDWWWLWSRRPLWDIAVIGLSLGGLALSLTAAAMSARRLRRSRPLSAK